MNRAPCRDLFRLSSEHQPIRPCPDPCISEMYLWRSHEDMQIGVIAGIVEGVSSRLGYIFLDSKTFQSFNLDLACGRALDEQPLSSLIAFCGNGLDLQGLHGAERMRRGCQTLEASEVSASETLSLKLKPGNPQRKETL